MLLRGVLLTIVPCLLGAQVPEGFEPIFNGSNLAGWHASLSSHHGDSREWRIFEGALVGQQDREGNGGILLTDEAYGDFELYLEVKPDFGCDGGVFLRSNESGQAYQVMLDYLDGGNVGGIFGEGLEGLGEVRSTGWSSAWKRDGWNALRIRIEGLAPRIEVRLNGTTILDFEDDRNRLPGEAATGSVALQVHGGDRCSPGLEHRFRNLSIRTL